MSRADNWMPLYVADYLRDTTHLSAEQHGAYLLLIMGAWTRGGVLPADDGQLSAIARLPLPVWRKAKGVVMAFFTFTNGGWEHKRVRAELERAQSLSNKRREASEKRWQTPSKTDAIASATDDATTIPGISPTGVAPPSPLPPPPEVSVVANAPTVSDRSSAKPKSKRTATLSSTAQQAWTAFPERGRQRSSTKLVLAEWHDAADRAGGEPQLLAAVQAYARSDRDAKGDTGAPAMHRWLKDARFESWLGSASPQAPIAAYAGPSDLRAAIAQSEGEGFAGSYVDTCHWQPDPPVLFARTGIGADELRKRCGPILGRFGVNVQQQVRT